MGKIIGLLRCSNKHVHLDPVRVELCKAEFQVTGGVKTSVDVKIKVYHEDTGRMQEFFSSWVSLMNAAIHINDVTEDFTVESFEDEGTDMNIMNAGPSSFNGDISEFVLTADWVV